MSWWTEWQAEYGYKQDSVTSGRAYIAMVEHFCPTVQRTDIEVLQDALDTIQEHISQLRPGENVELHTAMTAAGLDPTIRSDAHHVRKFLNENSLLTHQARASEAWVRRLNGPSAPSNDEAPASNDAVAD